MQYGFNLQNTKKIAYTKFMAFAPLYHTLRCGKFIYLPCTKLVPHIHSCYRLSQRWKRYIINGPIWNGVRKGFLMDWKWITAVPVFTWIKFVKYVYIYTVCVFATNIYVLTLEFCLFFVRLLHHQTLFYFYFLVCRQRRRQRTTSTLRMKYTYLHRKIFFNTGSISAYKQLKKILITPLHKSYCRNNHIYCNMRKHLWYE